MKTKLHQHLHHLVDGQGLGRVVQHPPTVRLEADVDGLLERLQIQQRIPNSSSTTRILHDHHHLDETLRISTNLKSNFSSRVSDESGGS